MAFRSNSRAAFTLVELSIVLVILGLLVGGVLAGQSLIEAAKIRRIAQQYNEYQLALNVFKEKYMCLPGDCDYMRRFMPGVCSTQATGDETCNGNGDGKIQGYEERYVCQQFGFAGLVAANCYGGYGAPSGVQGGVNALPSAYSTNNLVELIYYAGTGLGWANYLDHANKPGHYLITYMNSPDNEYYPRSIASSGTAMEMDYGRRIDAKLDDGLPKTGMFVNLVPFCGDDASNTYSGWYSTPNYKSCYNYYRIAN